MGRPTLSRWPGSSPGGGVRAGTWLGVGITAVAALVVAEGAVWLLRPRGAIDPIALSEHAYFTPAQIERAESFRDGQRLLFLAALAVETGALVAVALGRPAALRRLFESASRRPVLGAAAVGAGLSLGAVALTLPLNAIAHERAVDAGLATQDLAGWLQDLAKSAGIGAVLAAGGAALLIVLVRRAGRRWWVPAIGAVIAFEALFVWLAHRRSCSSLQPVRAPAPRKGPLRRARSRPSRRGRHR